MGNRAPVLPLWYDEKRPSSTQRTLCLAYKPSKQTRFKVSGKPIPLRCQHKGSVHYTGWNDSKQVVFGSNFAGSEKTAILRWSANSQVRAEVDGPLVAFIYNAHKSGADSADLRRAKFTGSHPSRKWTRAWIRFMIEEAESQAFIVGKKFVPALRKVDHEAFRLALCRDLLGLDSPVQHPDGPQRNWPTSPPKRRRFDPKVSLNSRTTGRHPIVDQKASGNNPKGRHACKLCYHLDGVEHRTRYFCANEDCLISLCLDKGHWNMWHSDCNIPEKPRKN